MNEGAQRLEEARRDLEDEAQWFKYVRSAMTHFINRYAHTSEGAYWVQVAHGFDDLPMHSKRKWVVWAQQRAESGDKRFEELFAEISIMRLTA